MHFPTLTLLTFLLTTTTTTAISILLPLYLYPGTSATAWQPLFYTLGNYTSTTFYIIIDPSSGPGCTSPCPSPTDPNYVTGITKLNKYKNALLLGYVSTNYTNRAYSAVVADVGVYANWGYYNKPGVNVSMAGIFFDEMDNSGSAASYAYYKNASAYAYANVPSDVTPVVFNPGLKAPAQYFDYADFIVECETSYANYKYPTTVNGFTAGYNSQAAVLLHNTTVGANLTALVHPLVTAGVGAVYVCPDGVYGDLSMLGNLTAAVKKG